MFGDLLKLNLSLATRETTAALPAGSIEELVMTLTPWGFEADVSFYVSSEEEPDEVFPIVTTTDLLSATLTLANGRAEFAQAAAEPLTLTGYVTHRRVHEVVAHAVAGQPLVGRRSWIRFVDPAQALWRQHQPIELHVDTSMKDLLELHKAPGMSILYDWGRLDQALDMLCVGLGGEQAASFYDFVMWYVHAGHGVIELDPATGTYRIGKTKARGGQRLAIAFDTVAELQLRLPEPPRHTSTLNNPSTEAPTPQKTLPNPYAVTGVSVGAFAHTLLADRFDARAEIETERLDAAAHEIELTYAACPEYLRAPGQRMVLDEAFSRRLHPSGKEYRLIELRLSAQRDTTNDGEADLAAETADYQMDLRARLELASDPTPRLPPFRRPRYPVVVEGRILSASGQESDRTFHAIEGERDSLFRYRVQIPLWNKVVTAPFVPGGLTGHFFFPAYKNQRVAVALGFDEAHIDTYLDWAGKLPKGTQGDQLVLGWNNRSETIVSHVYEEGKPVLKVARRLEGDTETITVSEGTLRIMVKEEQVEKKASTTYDVTPNVEVAKARTNAEVRGAITGVTGQFESSMNEVTESIDGARGEVDSALSASESKLAGKLSDAEEQLSTLSASGPQVANQLGDALRGAKADILAALE